MELSILYFEREDCLIETRKGKGKMIKYNVTFLRKVKVKIT